MQGVEIQSIYGAQYAQSEGVLLINLGSPASAEVSDVRQYLETFLMDERVISMPYFWRSLLVRRLIVPRRAPHSARNYRKIWEEETKTFPLVRHSATIAQSLSHQIKQPVALAMRYSAPTMADALEGLSRLGVERVKVVPLYPHYTRSSFETAVVHALAERDRLGLKLSLDIVPAFYNDELYREVLAESIRPYLTQPFDKLIVSMHGIPLSHLSRPCRANNGAVHCANRQHSPQEEATCYRLHCERTVRFLQQDLALAPERVELVYQSRLGNHEWIKPYFATRVKQWAREGTERLLVVSPGFICDCLETLEEIQVELRHAFLSSGGREFTYIPCLNSSERFIEVLSRIIRKPSYPK